MHKLCKILSNENNLIKNGCLSLLIVVNMQIFLVPNPNFGTLGICAMEVIGSTVSEKTNNFVCERWKAYKRRGDLSISIRFEQPVFYRLISVF